MSHFRVEMRITTPDYYPKGWHLPKIAISKAVRNAVEGIGLLNAKNFVDGLCNRHDACGNDITTVLLTGDQFARLYGELQLTCTAALNYQLGEFLQIGNVYPHTPPAVDHDLTGFRPSTAE